MINFRFADLHCHPTLKTYGHSFGRSKLAIKKSNFWYQKKVNRFTKFLQKLLGITQFSQADLKTLEEANVRLTFVSFYPFEKGFFKNQYLNDRVVAIIANLVTSIGYKRVRCIQRHQDYFEDLVGEYDFLLNALRRQPTSNSSSTWQILSRNDSISKISKNMDTSFIIPTIEGAHVFNTGLIDYGKVFSEAEVLSNIEKIKAFDYPPFFITFAHNFSNDLCGHAPSLQPLYPLVDQSKDMDASINDFGYEVLRKLLDASKGNRILIDVKHMSVNSRKDYYQFLDAEYDSKIPIIASHGAVTGTNYNGESQGSIDAHFFVQDSINFYDEELVKISLSKGLFALQMDAKRLAPKHMIKKSLFFKKKTDGLKKSTQIIFNQLIHIAEVLDAAGLYSWDTVCIGSDFDGTIDPLDGLWTALDFNKMANELLILLDNYMLHDNALSQDRNSQEKPLIIIENFIYHNAFRFLKRFYAKDEKNRIKKTAS